MGPPKGTRTMRYALWAVVVGVVLAGGAGCERGTATPAQGQYLADLEARAGEMTQALVEGNVADVTKRYTDRMQRALPDDKLREVWNDFQNQAGAFQQVDRTRHAFIRGFNVIFVDIQFASQPATLQYTFDGEDRLSGLYIRPYGFDF